MGPHASSEVDPMNCRLVAGVMLVCSCAWSIAQAPAKREGLPSAESVMARVGANQDRAEAERAHYVYVQHAKMVSRRGGEVQCEEITDYRFTPSSEGTREDLLKVDGRYLKNRQYVTYTKLLPRDEDKPKEPTKGQDKPANKDEGKNERK